MWCRYGGGSGDDVYTDVHKELGAPPEWCHGASIDIVPFTGMMGFASRPTKHLTVLSKAGLVRGSRRGREHVWQIEAKRLQHAHAYLDLISQQWDDALLRLKNFLD